MKEFWKKAGQTGLKLLKQWYTVVISCGIWGLLLLLWSNGVRSGIFLLLNYLTGALLSIDGENILGGIVGRTIVLMVLNTFFASVFMHKGSLKKRIAVAAISFRNGLMNLSEYAKAVSLFATKQLDMIFTGVMGLGLALICNTFITGNGEFINSFACVGLFLLLLKQFQAKTGFFLAMVNLAARKLGYHDICGERVSMFFSAFMSGCLVVPILALVSLTEYSYLIGAVLLLAGFVGLMLTKGKKKHIAAGMIILFLLFPQVTAMAQGTEPAIEVHVKQGIIEDGSQVEITDLVVNGKVWTETEAVLESGDTFGFSMTTSNPGFLSIQTESKICSNCNDNYLPTFGIEFPDGRVMVLFEDNYELKLTFEDVRVYDRGFSGKASGQIRTSYMILSEDGPWELCDICNPEHMGFSFSDYSLGRGIATIDLSDLVLNGYLMNDGRRLINLNKGDTDAYSTVISLESGESIVYGPQDTLYFLKGYMSSYDGFLTMETSEGVIWPEDFDEGAVNGPSIEDVVKPVPDEVTEHEVSPALATAVIAASVVGMGAATSVGSLVTSAVKTKLGIKKKGTLYVNGGVDIPTVYYDDMGEVNIPVHVVGADDLKWVISAFAVTPDDGKLVKAAAIPLGADQAQIHLEITRKPQKNVVSYLQVVAFAMDLTGVCCFHETMVEVTIELKQD